MERWRKIYLKFTGLSYSFNSSERSAARLAHLLWEQGVGSSNLPAPTRQKPYLTDIKPFFIEGLLVCQTDSINIKHIRIGDTDLGDTTGDTTVDTPVAGFFVCEALLFKLTQT